MAVTINFSTGLWVDTDNNGVPDTPAASVTVNFVDHTFTARTASGLFTSGSTGAAVNAIGTTTGADFMNQGPAGGTLSGLGGNDQLTGDIRNDVLLGGSGNDILSDHRGSRVNIDGGSGTDFIDIESRFSGGKIIGGTGKDTLAVNQSLPLFGTKANLSKISISGVEVLWTDFCVITAKAAQLEGFSQILTRVSTFPEDINREVKFVLAATGKKVVLNLGDELGDHGGRPAFITGSSDSESIIGSRLKFNDMKGGGGNDALRGGKANDFLDGGSGRDKLTGGDGRDFLTGGSSGDSFDFNLSGDSGNTASTRDVITDFEHGKDEIDLSTIDANGKASGSPKFHFVAKEGAHFSGHKGELIWDRQDHTGTKNDVTIIEVDIDGNKKSDFQIELTGLKTLASGDFVL